jgi:hypothetical protein
MDALDPWDLERPDLRADFGLKCLRIHIQGKSRSLISAQPRPGTFFVLRILSWPRSVINTEASRWIPGVLGFQPRKGRKKGPPRNLGFVFPERLVES